MSKVHENRKDRPLVGLRFVPKIQQFRRFVVTGGDFKSQVGDHPEIFFCFLTWSCQIVAHKHRVGRIQPHSLHCTQINFRKRRGAIVKAKVSLTGTMAVLVTSMASMLDARMAFRLSIIMAGIKLAA